MKDIEFTNEEIIGLNRSNEAAGQFEMPVSVALKIAAVTRIIGGYNKDYESVEKDLLKKYSKKDKEGETVYKKDEDGEPTREPVIENLDKFLEERNELLDETVEVTVPVFKKKDFDTILKLFGKDEDGNGGEEKQLPPVVMKAWIMLVGDDVNLEKLFE